MGFGRRRFAGSALLMAMLLALAASGCRTRAVDVVAADGALCDLSQRLAGEALRVQCLLGPNDDPHQFQLSPDQSRSLHRARLVLINGYGLTPALERLKQAVPVAELAVPDSPALQEGDGHGHHDDPAHGRPDQQRGRQRDPHVWHDPRQSQAMVRWLSQRLAALQPAAAASIQRRETAMLQTLTALDAWNRRQFGRLAAGRGQRTLASGHRAFSSLSRAYGLRELAVVDADSSAETLRPQALAAAVQQLRQQQVRALFSEQWPPSRALSRIAQLSGIRLAPAPLRADGLSGDLISTLSGNTCLIVNQLGSPCDHAEQQRLVQRWQAIR